ncbi:MAG: DUF3089 domain-containing protein, partial [Verrucomicrobia bacterium]|nr:DUF3089 domain-containing protein [Cytophagales bacterium]
LIFSLSLLAQKSFISQKFEQSYTPPPPDYTNPNYWAALPSKRDEADSLPKNKIQLADNQANAQADVFFLHPTIFIEKSAGKNVWNADVNDAEMNKNVDYSTILNQASVFNGSCKIYAPRYRQAHLQAFYTSDTATARKAFEVAYADIKASFEYYLENYNQNRPIVIAAHSQGTVHAKRLLKEFFDGKPLQKQLVAAYLVGIVTPPNFFENIPPGISAGQTGCFVNWRTYKKDYIPEDHYQLAYNKNLSVNPLTWDTTAVYADRKLNKGGVGLGFKLTKTAVVDAQNHEGLLWIGKIDIPGSSFIKNKNWHRADYNLFWMNIRENVALRIENYLKSIR